MNHRVNFTVISEEENRIFMILSNSYNQCRSFFELVSRGGTGSLPHCPSSKGKPLRLYGARSPPRTVQLRIGPTAPVAALNTLFPRIPTLQPRPPEPHRHCSTTPGISDGEPLEQLAPASAGSSTAPVKSHSAVSLATPDQYYLRGTIPTIPKIGRILQHWAWLCNGSLKRSKLQ